MNHHFLIQERREKKKRVRQESKFKLRYHLVNKRGPDGEPEMVFEEVSFQKKREDLQTIYIGKSEVQEEPVDEYEGDLEECAEMEGLDDEERRFLAQFMHDAENIEEVKEVEDKEDAAAEVVERHYEVADKFDNMPILEQTVQADQIEELSDDLDLRSAPAAKLSSDAKIFLLKQLYGENVELDADDVADPDAPLDEKEIQDGLDFFKKEIKVTKVEEIEQKEVRTIMKHLQEELSNGSDLDFGDEELFEEESEEQMQDQTFKMRKPKKQREVNLDMLNENKLAQEDVDAYVKRVEEEAAKTEQDKNAEFQNFVNQNTKILVQQETLESRIAKEQQLGKKIVNEASIISISKTGVPKNVFAQRERRESDPGDAENVYVKVTMPHDRPKDETDEERQRRKELVKEAKKLRKDQKRELKQQFASAKQHNQDLAQKQRKNVQGKALD